MLRYNNNYKQLFLIISAIISFIFVTRNLSLSDTALLWITDLSWTLAAAAVTWKCWQTSKLSQNHQKTIWRLFAYAHFSWLIGILIWDYLELIAQVTTPFPALSDIGFMIFTVFFIAALIKLKTSSQIKMLTALQLSKIGIFILSIIIIHIIVLSKVISISTENSLYISSAIIYPVLYMSAFLYALSSFWQILFFKSSYGLLLIILSIAVHAFVVSIYAYSLLGKTYHAGNYIDVLWLIAFGLMYLSTHYSFVDINSENKNSYSNIQKYFDVLLTPIAVFAILITIFIFNGNINSDNISIITFIALLFIVLFSVKEILNYRFEEKLKLSIQKADEEFHILSNTIPGVVYQFSINKHGDWYFPYISPRVYEMIGVDDSAIMKDAELFINQVHPDDMNDFKTSVLKSYNSISPWSWNGRILHVNGAVGWYNGESAPVMDNETVKWSGIIVDITEKTQAEMILKESKEILEFRVKERTIELEDAVVKAEVANNAKSEFLSHMSHELRTPLNAILGFGQLLVLDDLTGRQKTSAEEIVNAGEHLLNLINDILNLEAIESGNMNICVENVDLNHVVSQSLKLVNQTASAKNITINNTINTNENFFMLADELRVKEIIINLLSNAIKYNIDNGDITISVNKRENNLTLCVADTGKGIKKEDYQNVFEPFNRLGAEKGNIEGSGIGLTICKKIVEAMDGTITFESQINKGTTFCITLPASNKLH